MDKKIKKSIFARIKQWLLNIFGLSKEEDGSNTKPASNDAGQESVDSPSTIAEKSAEEHTAPHSSNTEQTASEILERVKAIEKYLSLEDVAINSQRFDFSFIQDDEMRAKLMADHIEMWRCRLGIRGNKQEFDAFCIYVSIQVECLLRYYQNFIPEENKSAASMMFDFYKTIYGNSEFSDEYNVLNAVREVRNVYMHSILGTKAKAEKYIKDNNIKIYTKSFNGMIVQEVDQYLRNNEEVKEKKVVDKEKREKDFEKVTSINKVSTYHNYLRAEILKQQQSFDFIYSAFITFCNKIEEKITNLQ